MPTDYRTTDAYKVGFATGQVENLIERADLPADIEAELQALLDVLTTFGDQGVSA